MYRNFFEVAIMGGDASSPAAWRAAQHKQISQRIPHVRRIELAINADHPLSGRVFPERGSLSCVFIDDVQCSIDSPVSCPILGEDVGPDMVGPFWAKPDTRSIIQPKPSFLLFLRDFQPLTPLYPLNPLNQIERGSDSDL